MVEVKGISSYGRVVLIQSPLFGLNFVSYFRGPEPPFQKFVHHPSITVKDWYLNINVEGLSYLKDFSYVWRRKDT